MRAQASSMTRYPGALESPTTCWAADTTLRTATASECDDHWDDRSTTTRSPRSRSGAPSPSNSPARSPWMNRCRISASDRCALASEDERWSFSSSIERKEDALGNTAESLPDLVEGEVLVVSERTALSTRDERAQEVATLHLVIGKGRTPPVATQRNGRGSVSRGEFCVLPLGVHDDRTPTSRQCASQLHLDHCALARADGTRHDDVGIRDQPAPYASKTSQHERRPVLALTQGLTRQTGTRIVGRQAQTHEIRRRRPVRPGLYQPGPPGNCARNQSSWCPHPRSRRRPPSWARRQSTAQSRCNCSSDEALTTMKTPRRTRARPLATSTSR